MKKLYTLLLVCVASLCSYAQGNYQTITLDVNDALVEYVKTPAFNGAVERSCYFISLANTNDPVYNIPLMNVTWNHEDPSGLVAGTYTLSKGEIEEVCIMQDAEEDFFNGYNIGIDPYGVTEAWLTLEEKGTDLWNITIEAVDQYGDHYVASMPWRKDVKDAYSKEPAKVTNMELDFATYDLIDVVAANNVLDFSFETTPDAVTGERYVCELIFQTAYHDMPKAGTYKISDGGEMGTFRASFGGGASGPTPCFVGVWDGSHLGDRWYITSGEVSISYPTENTLLFEGTLHSYFGSTFTFRYEGQNIEAGVHQIIADGAASAHTYDLMGRRVEAPLRGLYVKGGRKSLVH